MNNIIIIKKIKMCRIGHSSALCGRIGAPRIDALPYKTGNQSNAGKQTPIPGAKPNPYVSSPCYGHPEAHRAFGRDIMIYKIVLYY